MVINVNMCHLYILKSLKDKKYYVGITSNFSKRLEYHNNGYVKSTKNRRPFSLIYSEEYASMSEARIREKYLKSYKGSKEKLTIIENCVIVYAR